MTLRKGTQLGNYEIIAALGAGGMGEVYRARDPKLGRDVAIKVLPADFSTDAERLRRFEQEAQAVGALNHPNILVIFHIGSHDGAPYIVSELLEGKTLRDRMGGAALPQRKAMDYALQTVQGLAAAHAKGIVHRDLKPENLFITNDGRVKILDFGLAKMTGAADGNQSQTEVPTRRVDTDPGLVMGTMGYMSPEQLRGKPADNRSDLFSFGAILYEMLSGKRAFRGDSMAETMSAILREDPPDLSETNKTASPTLERLVHHCLEKNPDERFHSARDLAFAIESLSGATSSGQTMMTTADVKTATENGGAAGMWRLFRNARLAWMVAGALLLGLLAALMFAVSYFRRAPTEASAVRFAVPLPENATIEINYDDHNLSVSPNGRSLVFVAVSEGESRLWLRPLDTALAQVMPGTEGAYSPFWSPDSRYIAFFAGGKLRRIEPSGTSPQTICDLSGEVDTTGTWGRDGVILYADRLNEERRIYRVAAAGGTPAPITENKQFGFYWVRFLPDGRHYLLCDRNLDNPAVGGVYVASLDSSETKLLLRTSATRVEYAKGYLLYAREGSLLAQPFDEKNLRLSGEPFTVVERLPYFYYTGWAEFSVSENGVLAYMTELPATRLVWLDRGGHETGQIAAPGIYPGIYSDVRLSPDGQKIALTINDPRTRSGDLWIHDLVRGTPTRFAFGPAADESPVWSPDGRRLAYFSCCEDKSTLYIKGVSDTVKGQTSPEPGFQIPVDWSPDGRFILFTHNPAETNRDLWVLPMDGDRKPFPFLVTPFNESQARFSPNGRWVAFVSNETGRADVYVTRFDRPGEKLRISSGGGTGPCWRRDGKELFFLAADKSVMSVPVKDGDTFEFGTPAPLFRNDSIMSNAFDVTADGQRFVVISSAAQTQTMPFTVVVNWTAELKK